jgi:hypothetical protein
MDAQRSDNRKRVLIGLGAVAAVVALVLAAIVLTDDDDEPVSSGGSSTTTSETTTTSSTSSTTTTTIPFQGVDLDVPLYPDPTTSQRFDDPSAAAHSFATWAGFTHPVIGEFRAGDARSGEIEVRSFEGGAPTIVLLRQLEDDAWYVIGSTTESIKLDTPQPGASITSPQELAGQAFAFEGNVVVRLYADGVQEPIAQTNVTGRGDMLGPFSGELEFSNDTGAGHGVLLLFGTSGEDGGATDLAAIRVRL